MMTKISTGETLGQKYTNVLTDIMYRCNTGKRRLRAGLPAGTRIAHKTGTFQRQVTNDAGVIALPGKSGHVVVVVLIKGSSLALETQEDAIAQVARAVYEHFASARISQAAGGFGS